MTSRPGAWYTQSMGTVEKVVDLASDKVRGRWDSWTNALTGIGDALRDKLTFTSFVDNKRLSDEQAEALFHGEDLAAHIVSKLPRDGVRRWMSVSVGDSDADFNDDIQERLKDLGAKQAVREAATWGRAFGGAVVYIGIEDGLEEDQPVDLAKIERVEFLTVLDKRDIRPHTYSGTLERFGEPETYKIQHVTTLAGEGGEAVQIDTSTPIHHTRLLRFGGSMTSKRRRQRNNGWDDSILGKLHEVLLQFNVGWQGTAHLLQDAAQGVFKIQGLVDMIAGGDKEVLQNRMQVVEMGRSVARAIMLDAEFESFERQDYSFAGVPDVLRAFMLRLAAAAEMPVVVLMGQSPSGLNATGESDIRIWYDSVEAWQEDVLLPHLERLVSYLGAERDSEGKAPERFEITFHSLWQMTDKENAELQKMVGDRDVAYINSGVLLAEEVALSRFTPDGFSLETQIDLAAREEMLKAEIDLAKDKAGEDPLDAPPPGGAPGAPAPAGPPAAEE